MSAETSVLTCGFGHEVPIGHELLGCPRCRADGRASSLEVGYEREAIRAAWTAMESPDRGLGGYEVSGALPTGAGTVTLGEGRTPLLAYRVRGQVVGDVWLKLEGYGPTGSYKDRLNAVAVSMAVRFGAKGIVCSSTGNQGASMSAYAAAADLPAVVLLPTQAPEAAARQAATHGSIVILTPWEVRPKAIDLLLRSGDWSLSNRNDPRPWANPFGLEGYRSIAFEIVRDLGHVPSRVVVPTCGGDGLYGVWKGFRELLDAGVTTSAPMMVAVQPAFSNSLVRAVARDADRVDEIPLRQSVALSLTDRKTGDLALRAVRESGGLAVDVSEDEIRDSVRGLARVGVYAEPASAAAIAALARLNPFDGETVCVITASGTRWPMAAASGEYLRLSTLDEVMAHIETRVPAGTL